jgi:hypothetical protein
VQDFPGQCHCGNISVIFQSDKDTKDFVPRICECTFCTKHGARWISDPAGTVIVTIKDDTRVSKYAFGHETAEFITCSRCGVTLLAVSEIEGNRHAVLNVNVLDDQGSFTGTESAFDYDAESELSRLDRRKKNWIGRVELIRA